MAPTSSFLLLLCAVALLSLPTTQASGGGLTIVNCFFQLRDIGSPSTATTIVMDSPHEGSFSHSGRIVYLQSEPESIVRQRDWLLRNGHRYSYVVTFDKPVLQQLPNAVQYLVGGSLIPEDEIFETFGVTKQYRMTALVGHKRNAEGHLFRHTVWNNQRMIKNVPITFYRSTNGPAISDINNNPFFTSEWKMPLFKDVQYSLVIENSREENYFTEKLIDCLLGRAIPIYWGAPNIGEFFDTRGMIILSSTSIDDFLRAVSVLNEKYYESHIEAVNHNFRTAIKYKSLMKNVNHGLFKIPNW